LLKGIIRLMIKFCYQTDRTRRHVVIEKATHNFRDSDEVMLKLFAETANWFKETCNARV
jgi:hypothetical protein